MKFEKFAKILIKGQEGPDTVSNAEDFGNLILFYMGEDAKRYYDEILERDNLAFEGCEPE